MTALALLAALPAPASAWADTFTLDLTSSARLDAANSTGLWNTVDGRIQAAVAPVNGTNDEVSFGDGSDGAFADGPAQTGISVSGATITVNTDLKSAFAFTSFSLTAGKTMRVTGSKALTIRVLGNATIAGTVDLNGAAGADNTSGAGAGGAGTANGGNGGAGGVAGGANGVAGTPTNILNDGGTGGTNTAAAFGAQGGGGGCNGGFPSSPTAGDGNIGSEGDCSGATQSQRAQDFEALFPADQAGGGGGGGGGAFTGVGPMHGAGGGGGGGAIRLITLGAVDIQATGLIQARGGDGGDNPNNNGGSGDCGAGGGGGAGGAIWIQSVGAVGGAGGVDVTRGLGGTSTDCAGINFGGNASRGVVRIDSTAASNTLATIAPATVSDVQPQLQSFAGRSYVVYSKPIDFSDAYWSFGSASASTGCGSDGTLDVAVEGSGDGVTFGSAKPLSSIAELSDTKYLRLKVSISVTGANPPCLTALSFEYDQTVVRDFRLGGLACGTVSGGSGSDGGRGAGGLGGWMDLAMIGIAVLLSRPRRFLAMLSPERLRALVSRPG